MSTRPRKRLTAPQRREVIERAASEVFSERGYHGASIDEIARRSEVSPPVVYDHFASKRDLHRRLLERHFGELRQLWRDSLAVPDLPADQRFAGALDAWFAYLERHPYAWRMLFRDTSGDPEIEAIHHEVAAASRGQILPLLASEPGAGTIAGATDPIAMEMLFEVVRGVLQTLALWWHEHQDVPRERVVATAMNALWVGFERAADGESWSPPGPAAATPRRARPPADP